DTSMCFCTRTERPKSETKTSESRDTPTEPHRRKKLNKIIDRSCARLVPSCSLAALEHISPIAPQRGPQAHQRWKPRKVVTGFNALYISRAQARLFREFLLGETSPRPQRRDILSKSHPMRTGSRLTLRHS